MTNMDIHQRKYHHFQNHNTVHKKRVCESPIKFHRRVSHRCLYGNFSKTGSGIEIQCYLWYIKINDVPKVILQESWRHKLVTKDVHIPCFNLFALMFSGLVRPSTSFGGSPQWGFEYLLGSCQVMVRLPRRAWLYIFRTLETPVNKFNNENFESNQQDSIKWTKPKQFN